MPRIHFYPHFLVAVIAVVAPIDSPSVFLIDGAFSASGSQSLTDRPNSAAPDKVIRNPSLLGSPNPPRHRSRLHARVASCSVELSILPGATRFDQRGADERGQEQRGAERVAHLHRQTIASNPPEHQQQQPDHLPARVASMRFCPTLLFRRGPFIFPVLSQASPLLGSLMSRTNQISDWALHDRACVYQAELQQCGRQIILLESVSLLQLPAATIGATPASSSVYRTAVYPGE
ncbi:hypothetical protein VTG60DRAFT_3185 [Thermothelomyces hinnuleus]